jgi:hypothetical protein
MPNVLSEKECALIDAYWRAANYLSVGQIYLFDNPLLKVPLTKDHIKPRLLGHWGTTTGSANPLQMRAESEAVRCHLPPHTPWFSRTARQDVDSFARCS